MSEIALTKVFAPLFSKSGAKTLIIGIVLKLMTLPLPTGGIIRFPAMTISKTKPYTVFFGDAKA